MASVEQLLRDNPARLWRAREQDAVSTAPKGLSTGYVELDRCLPGQGWPRQGLIEILSDQRGIGELRLLMPALAHLCAATRGGWIAWVSPPYTPYAPALAAAGVDVARVLAKTGDEMLVTDIPAHVHAGLKAKTITDVHVFARRGPAYAKFSPLELRELNHSPNVEVIVHPEGFDVDEHGMAHIAQHKAQKMVLNTLTSWVGADPVGKPHRIHLHFAEAPVAITGEDGRVTSLRTERTHSPLADGDVEGTGEFTDWDVQGVYRAVGYRSTALPSLPFDDRRAVIPNDGGRVLDLDGDPIPGTFVTGWIKRGPVGLIGHTKSDAAETVGHLLADTTPTATARRPEDVDASFAERDVDVATHTSWELLDAHEIALGEAAGRARVKVAEREEMLRIGRGSR